MARIVLICAAVAVTIATGGCGGGGPASGDAAEIVAAFYPLAFLADEIAGDAMVVRNLTPAGAEPHDLELSAGDVSELQSADLVLYVGGGFMPGLERALVGARGEAVDLWGEGVLEDGRGDPHVWLDPRRLAEAARRVGRVLERPEAGNDLARRLLDLDAELERGLAVCDRRELVTSHAAFAYLADRYGLEQIALGGLAPEAEPPARELEALAEHVRATGATTVFTEPLVSPRLAETVAKEAGVRTAVLDPLEGLSAARLDAGADYVSVMRENLAALRKALGCT